MTNLGVSQIAGRALGLRIGSRVVSKRVQAHSPVQGHISHGDIHESGMEQKETFLDSSNILL